MFLPVLIDLRRLAMPARVVLATGAALGLVACGAQADTSGSTAPPPPASQLAPKASPAEKSLGLFTVTCHTGSGATASGRPDGPGMAAVDTDVFPLGTSLRVQDVGTVVAADRGSAVDGRSLDVWTPSTSACTAFGRKHLQVWRVG